MPSNRTRTLTTVAAAGLCSRLQVLLSGAALAEATGRRLRMLWPRTPGCAAVFHELFEAGWPVEEISHQESQALARVASHHPDGPDLTRDERDEQVVYSGTWLIAPQSFPAHATLMRRCEELVRELEPVQELRQRVEAFRRVRFRPRMIGVHLRRGDRTTISPVETANTTSALRAVDGFLSQFPDAGILLCTDDGAVAPWTGRSTHSEGICALFQARYGDRVAMPIRRTLDCRDPRGVQDAVVDLWLLRSTDVLVVTVSSAFSAMAGFGRDVPVAWCEARHPLRQLIPVLRWCQGRRSWRWVVRHYWRTLRRRLPRSDLRRFVRMAKE